MYALYMNPVTANAEQYIPVAISETPEALENLLKINACEPAQRDGYFRSYKAGPLYNFNPPTMNGRNCFGVNEGIVEVVSDDQLRRYHQEELQKWNEHFCEAIRVQPVI